MTTLMACLETLGGTAVDTAPVPSDHSQRYLLVPLVGLVRGAGIAGDEVVSYSAPDHGPIASLSAPARSFICRHA